MFDIIKKHWALVGVLVFIAFVAILVWNAATSIQKQFQYWFLLALAFFLLFAAIILGPFGFVFAAASAAMFNTLFQWNPSLDVIQHIVDSVFPNSNQAAQPPKANWSASQSNLS